MNARALSIAIPPSVYSSYENWTMSSDEPSFTSVKTPATRPDASSTATVLQVRAHDEPGLLHTVASVLAEAGACVRSAVVDTLGADVVDVFYLTDDSGRPLDADVAEALRDHVSEAIGGRA